MKVVCAIPFWLVPLAEALAEKGHEVHHLWPVQGGGEYAHVTAIAGVDLKKALLATNAAPEVTEEISRLASHASMGARLFDGIVQLKPDAVVVGYTADPNGRAALAAAKHLNVPLIHVQHNCNALVPEDAWFLRDAPGDVVLAPGERDRQWWARCAPDAKVVVCGHPMWDAYATLQRGALLAGKPVVCWIAESGANATQSPLVYQFKDAPERAWQGFLGAIKLLKKDVRVVVKVRPMEDRAVIDRWVRDAEVAGLDAHVTDAPCKEVLPWVDLVVHQQSNAGVEALHLGIPVVTLTRPGVTLLEKETPSLSILSDQLECSLADHIGYGLLGSELTPQKCREIAAFHNAGIDGGGMARTVAAIETAVAAPAFDRVLVAA
ncbi:MAG TPA: glycosyltransferase [Rhodothermales bacterium]|nr:glycosyltransferase [Rhodothermales bacterium]